MQRSVSFLLLLAFLLPAAFAAPEPTHFTAYYTMSKGSVPIGEVQRSLTPAGSGQFKFESTMHATGLIAAFVKDRISESSLWTFRNEQVRPQIYTYRKSGGKKSRDLKLEFDWQHQLVKNTIAGKEWEMALLPDSQDKLSYQLAIMYDLQRGKTEFKYPIADKMKFRNYYFKVVGHETLATPLGSLPTVKIERVMEGDEKTTVLWCAPGLDFLPVRIEQNEKDGDEFSLMIKSVEGL